MSNAPRLRPSGLNGLAFLALATAAAILSDRAPRKAEASSPVLEPIPEPEPPAAPNVSPVRPHDLEALGLSVLGFAETCDGCRFYMPANSRAGECRRFAPTFGETAAGEWPVTTDKQWCGEYSPAFLPTSH